VTHADLNYEGSITIDRDLMDAVGIVAFEAVDVYNISMGTRFRTYVIEGDRGSGDIRINGAAARLAFVGDLVIIAAFRFLEEGSVPPPPAIVQVDGSNRVSG
jgi:aspartate 1-decarboxylase